MDIDKYIAAEAEWWNQERNFMITQIDAPEPALCYSASSLQAELNKVLAGQRLRRLSISLADFLHYRRYQRSLLDLTDMGGYALWEFDTDAVEIEIYGEGIVKYRVFPLEAMKTALDFGVPPEDCRTQEHRYFFDVSSAFSLPSDGLQLEYINIERINARAFNIRDVDIIAADAAERRNDLPNNIHFRFSGGTTISMMADDIESYWIEQTNK